LGGELARVARTLGDGLNTWQRHVGDVSLELEASVRRGRRLRRLSARYVGAVVPRQCGKSYVVRARAVLSCVLPELEVGRLVGGRVGAQHVGWLCQDRAAALRPWLECVDAVMSGPYRELVRKVRLQRGDEVVAFGNGSTLRPVTPSRTGPRGHSFDLVVLDEALAHDAALLAALAPTQAARDSAPASLGAQLFVVSTAGDERSTLLHRLGELGRRAVLTGDDERVWFEWSTTDADDPYDPAVWRATIPTLDRAGGISSAFVALQAEALDVAEFRREYLCLHSARPADPVLDVDGWLEAPRAPVDGDSVVFAIDATPACTSSALVVAAPAVDGYAVDVVDARPGVEWITPAVVERARRWAAPVVVVVSGPVGWLIPRLEGAGVDVVAVQGRDVLAAAAGFAELVAGRHVAHRRDPRLDSAVDAARRRHSGDRWAFDRSAGDLSPLVAASLAVWALEAGRVLQVAVW
jgi:hypothetical protein